MAAGCYKMDDPCTGSVPEIVAGVPGFEIRDEDGRLILSAADIASYDWTTHSMTLSSGRVLVVQNSSRHGLVGGIPFTVIANGVPCYSGAFTSSYSSTSLSCPIIDAHTPEVERGVVRLELGYPSPEFFKGEDPRGDERVRDCLRVLGKLSE